MLDSNNITKTNNNISLQEHSRGILCMVLQRSPSLYFSGTIRVVFPNRHFLGLAKHSGHKIGRTEIGTLPTNKSQHIAT